MHSFMVNIVPKVYEKVKKSKMKKKIKKVVINADNRNTTNMSNRQNLNHRCNHWWEGKKKIYLLFPDAVKCLEKLWLGNWIIEVKAIGYKNINLTMLYKLNKTTDLIFKTPFGETKQYRNWNGS